MTSHRKFKPTSGDLVRFRIGAPDVFTVVSSDGVLVLIRDNAGETSFAIIGDLCAAVRT